MYSCILVCVMRGIAPKRKPDLENKGKLVDDYWSPGQQMLGDIKFLETLKSYDKVIVWLALNI